MDRQTGPGPGQGLLLDPTAVVLLLIRHLIRLEECNSGSSPVVTSAITSLTLAGIFFLYTLCFLFFQW